MMVDEVVLDKCRGKSVLHVGAIGDWQRFIRENNYSDWSYLSVRDVSRETVGIDIDVQGLKAMKKKGFKLQYGDIEDIDIGRKFDVVFCGDIIEHVNNIGLFFHGCKRHMNKDSLLIITTNNPYSANMILRAIHGDVSKGIYYDHTTLLYEGNLRLFAQRYGLEVISTRYFTLMDYRSKKLELLSYLLRLFGWINKKYHMSHATTMRLKTRVNK